MVSTRAGSRLATIAPDDVAAWIEGYDDLHVDMGTGDGTFALRMAREHPDMAVIGIDTCLDNLTKATRKPPANLRFLTCDATDVPAWLEGRATCVSINFPYGSLLCTVAGPDEDAWQRLLAVAGADARIDIRINASAGADHGLTLEGMRTHVGRMLRSVAPCSASITVVAQGEMRSFPSTWAKRLAYGRPSQVIVASARIGD